MQAQRAQFPLTLPLNKRNLHKQTLAKISQTRTLSITRLGKNISRALPEELDKIIEGLIEIIA